MVQQRNLATAIILTVLTCGIYGIYWFIVLTDDVGKLSGDLEFTGVKHLLLSIVTCGIWSLVWAYQVGKQVAVAQEKRGVTVADNSTMYLIVSIFGFGIIAYALVQGDVNKMAQA
jgi:hypothetical protein